MIIAVDGPAASGKGTLAQGLAAHFGLPHLDTGLLYRGVGQAVKEYLDQPDLEVRAVAAAQMLDKKHLNPGTLGKADIAIAAAKVARIEGVRAMLRQFQRDFADQDGGAILDGRDIGTRICPKADVKLYITARPETRAARRTMQLRQAHTNITEAEVLAQIMARDESDRTNPAGAFYVAADAHLLDTSEMDIETALRAAIEIVEKAVASKAGR